MRHRSGLLIACAAAGFIGLIVPAPARASLLISVDKSKQQMTVIVDGDPRYIWPVATGIARYDTPDGEYKPFRMEKEHYSREWDDAPMPYSIFFTNQGHAIHGTNHKITGAPASHGCVRLSVRHAAQLWALVKEQKMANTRVELTGDIPTREELVARRSEPDADRDTSDARDDRDDRARIAADDDDDARDIPRPGQGWAAYREGGRTYYYRTGPREVQRVYRRVYRYYRHYGGFPW